MEQQVVTFADTGNDMDAIPNLDLPDLKTVPVELPLTVEVANDAPDNPTSRLDRLFIRTL